MPRHTHEPSDSRPEGPSHRNRGLFSDTFLEKHIPALAGDDLATARSLRRQVNDLCARAVERAAGRREASVEAVLIRPVLELLGFTYAPNPPLPTGSGTEAPDYALFDSPEAEQAAQDQTEGRQYFEHCLGLAEAKPWDRPLGATARRGRRRKDRRHPGKQIRDYLYESGVSWGILTNGRLWRLYNREASRGENYYEVDLVAISAEDDPDAWRYFYLFFRRQAFEIQDDGRRPLDAWLAGSRDYAVGLTKRLRGNVYEALRYLMEGFFAWPDNELDWERDSQRVHQAALVLLYRLLFVLYAEARDLMPVANPAYRDAYSLQHRKRQIAEQLERGGGYDKFGASLWNWLRDELFRLVDEGHQALGVPQYNGGLFRAERWPLLHDPKIRLPDHYIAQAIDLLARDAAEVKGQPKAFVDYSELGVRELGSIYEGLLEMRPHLAVEPMIEVRPAAKSKQPDVIPESATTEEQKLWSQRHGQRYARGEVYLLTDRGERKQTGSYYTPEYIVNYIVENALGPLTDECARQVAERRPQAEREIAKREQVIAERGDVMDTSAERFAIERLKLELLVPYFDLKVLDPAMGSGHFLVGAADFITDAILTDPNHLPPDEAGGDEALYYKRRVVERCLYGVDINPLAVELAKLSLWLHTVQKDRALSFLDHHLRCGNSLIGAWVESDLSKAPPVLDKRGKQVRADGGQLILGFYDTLRSRHLEGFLSVLSEIEETPTINAQSEAHKNHLYRALDELRDPYRQVANVWLSPYFMPPGSLINFRRNPDMPPPVLASQYHEAVEALAAGTESEQWAALVARRWFQAAQKVAGDNCFFHWELEFPEVWYERGRRKENPGFDAVIGNPPYGQWGAREYMRSRYPLAAENGDLFVGFMESGLRLPRRGGVMGWIVPVTWQTGLNYSRLRAILLSQASFLRIVNLPFDVFPDAYVDTGIAAIRAEPAQPGWTVHTYTFPKTATIDSLGGLTYHDVDQCTWMDTRGMVVINPAAMNVLVKLDTILACAPLGSLTESCRGILARDEDVSDECRGPDWKPLFTGEMGRYDYASASRFVLYSQQLLERPSSFDVFAGERLLVRRLVSRQDRVMATVATDVFVNKKDVYVFKPSAAGWRVNALLAVVNSRLMSFACLERDVAATKDDFRQTTLAGLRALPIRRIHFTTPADNRMALVRGLTGAYDQWVLSQADSGEAILARVEELLPRDENGRFLAFAPGATGAEEKSDVVHDFLAYLAEQMIELNKQKQAEVKRFIEWLQTEIRHDLADLRQKTRIHEYHEGNLDDLLAALRANDKPLNRIAHRSDFQSDLRREFDISLSRLTPLKARIAATDALIDQIVYRLYGLTEEEIAVVAGAAAKVDV